MTDLPPSPDEDRGMVYDRESPSGMRWVKVAGIVLAVVALLVVVMLLVGGGGGGHGPRRHGGAGRQAPPSCVTAVQVPLLLAARS